MILLNVNLKFKGGLDNLSGWL